MRKIFTVLFCALVLTKPAYAEPENNDVYIAKPSNKDILYIANFGNCPVYKAELYTVPQKKDSLSSMLSRFGATTLGVGSFTKKLPTIEISSEDRVSDFVLCYKSINPTSCRYFIKVKLSDLTRSDGQRLSKDFEIGSILLDGTSCGERDTLSAWAPGNMTNDR